MNLARCAGHLLLFLLAHDPAQNIRFAQRKARQPVGNLHYLFWYRITPVRFLPGCLQLRQFVADLSSFKLALDEIVDHPALGSPGGTARSTPLDQLRTAAIERHPGRNVRRDSVPGTGNADWPTGWRAFRWRKRIFCAGSWARRKGGDGRAARQVHGRLREQQIPEKKAERIFNLMEEFGGYGFNKSHSCAYALLAYQTAYLKTHYPVEFMAALLTSEAGNTDKIVKYINEARGMSIPILPPDVNESDLLFHSRQRGHPFRPCRDKKCGREHREGDPRIAFECRRIRSLYEFCERIESRFLNKRSSRSLIKSGAMDSLGARESMLASVDDAVMALQRATRVRESGQHGLFGTAAAPAPVAFEMREARALERRGAAGQRVRHAGFLRFGSSPCENMLRDCRS